MPWEDRSLVALDIVRLVILAFFFFNKNSITLSPQLVKPSKPFFSKNTRTTLRENESMTIDAECGVSGGEPAPHILFYFGDSKFIS